MKESIKEALSNGKRQLIGFQKLEDEKKKKELDIKNAIKNIVDARINDSTEEFAAELISYATEILLNSYNSDDDTIEIQYLCAPIEEYFVDDSVRDMSYRDAIQKITDNPTLETAWKLDESEFFALAQSLGYKENIVLYNIFIIDNRIFEGIMNEYKIGFYYREPGTVCISKHALNRALMDFDEKKTKQLKRDDKNGQ